MLTVRAHQKDRVEQFEHTRAICYFIAIQYMGENKISMEDFWSLPSDEFYELMHDEDAMLKYMREVQKAYDDQKLFNSSN